MDGRERIARRRRPVRIKLKPKIGCNTATVAGLCAMSVANIVPQNASYLLTGDHPPRTPSIAIGETYEHPENA